MTAAAKPKPPQPEPRPVLRARPRPELDAAELAKDFMDRHPRLMARLAEI